MSATVVLCGSLGSTAAMWEPQLETLRRRRVVAVDHPGHGAAPVTDARSMAALAARTLEEVGPGTFSFVGLSLGGAVGMRLALDAPERLEKLVLASTAARFGEPHGWHERAATVRESGLAAIADAVLARWFTPAFGDAAAFRAMFLSIDAEGYARCCEALAGWDVRDELGAIETPTLVISGAEDPSTTPVEGKALAARIPGARFEVLANAAHLANVERPDAFNRLLEDHL
ncbi:MAG TPA: alpha/beta fold hydrolase [Gaiellaceae bacterium]|nr:alpha/beta fold hydrolase [Gaiellaceae bacterium]